jgi:hypothetical protein
MPKQKGPIKQRPTVEDESTGNGSEYHGAHRDDDEGLPGKGSSKGGLNRDSGGGSRGTRQNDGLSKGNSSKSSGLRQDRT